MFSAPSDLSSKLYRLATFTFILLLFLSTWSLGREGGGEVPASLLELSLSSDTSTTDVEVCESRGSAIVLVAEKVGSTVVTINTLTTVRGTYFNPFYDFFHFFDFYSPMPYYEYEQKVPGMGSGFIISPDGYIMTAEHVVHGVDEISVVLADGSEFPAELVGADYASDVAVLKIDARDLPVAELGDSEEVQVGQWAIAIGHPFGKVVGGTTPTVTVGVISAKDRSMSRNDESGFRVYSGLLQTDASINPGNSGGPLVNSLGQVIGINTAIITTSGGSLGIGFAIPINIAREVAIQLIEYGKIVKAWLGVYVQNMTPQLAEALGAGDSEGVLISDLSPDGPAADAGLKRGDIIKEMAGEEINSIGDYDRVMQKLKPQETIEMVIERGGKRMTGEVAVSQPPGGEEGR